MIDCGRFVPPAVLEFGWLSAMTMTNWLYMFLMCSE